MGMRNQFKVIIRIILGFIACALSTVVMINSNLGLSPWDVFHEGISKIAPITIGEATIIVGIVFLVFGIILGEKLGIGTILNIILVGYFIDFIIYLDVIPKADNLLVAIIMMILGLLFMGYGCYLYIGCGLGCGPRDSVMLGIYKKTGISIKYIRGVMEVLVMVVGYILGGQVGLGTIISAIGLGYSMQIIFEFFKFDPSKIIHQSFMETIKSKSLIKE